LDPANTTHILFSSSISDEHFTPHYGHTLFGLRNLLRNMLEQLKLVAQNLLDL
jgi:hypothetical protein